MSTSSNNVGPTLGKLLAGYFLYDFTENGKSGTRLMKVAVAKLKNYLGNEEATGFFQTTNAMLIAIVNALIDMVVIDDLGDETKKMMHELSHQERVFVELFVLKVTGAGPTEHGRWAQPLWRLRTMSKKYLELSPTEVKPEELASTLKEIFVPMALIIREEMHALQ